MSLGIKLITVGGLLSNCLVTGLLLLISHNNYPGGVALQRLHKLLDNHTGIMENICLGIELCKPLNLSPEGRPRWTVSQGGIGQGISYRVSFWVGMHKAV